MARERDQWSGLEKIGELVAGKRSKWVTLLVWIALVALLNAIFPQANSQENNRAANFGSDVRSVQAEAIAAQQFPNEDGIPALLVWHRPDGLNDGQLQRIQALAQRLNEAPLPDQTLVPPLHRLPLPVLKQQVSTDGSSLIMPIFFNEAADAERMKENFELLKKTVGSIMDTDPFASSIDDPAALSARITGPAGILVDATELFSKADFSLLIATVLIVLILLLLIYRSPILAIIPLIGVGFAYGVISPILGWLGQEGWATFDSQGLSIMTVLLFGAGTDYCLFLTSRYRQELREQERKLTAIRKALAETSGAIAMSGLTTVFALMTLLLAKYGTVARFALPFGVSIVIMGFSTLTLVPAILAIIGRASFFPFIPRTREMIVRRAEAKGKPIPAFRERVTLGDRLGEIVVRKPVWVTAISLALLMILASFATQVKFTFDTLSSFPDDMPSKEGFKVIGQSFQPGQLAPVKIIVDTDGKSLELRQMLESLDYVGKAHEPVRSEKNNEFVSVDVELAMNPYSNEALDRIPDLQKAVEATVAKAGISNADEHVWIAGQTSEQYDTRETTYRDAKVIIPTVIGLIALLLLLYLRSVTATIYLIATVVFSYFSALGLGWLIIHYVLGADSIQGLIPLYSFVFLVALGEDYNIFMMSSIWRKARTMPFRKAIKEGASKTGGVITSAGLILAGTFAVLATLPIQILVHFGIITAIGVLLDTFVVRPFLVPAITALLGRKAFWPAKAPLVEEVKPEKA